MTIEFFSFAAFLLFLLLFFFFLKSREIVSTSPADDVFTVTCLLGTRLGIYSEHTVFFLAYHFETGLPVMVFSKRYLEQCVEDYRLHSKVPPWLANFTKKVLLEHDMGTLDPERYRQYMP